MTLPEELPSVSWKDTEIRNWAFVKCGNLQKVKVQLVGAVHPEQPDVATVHFDQCGSPVTRTKEQP